MFETLLAHLNSEVSPARPAQAGASAFTTTRFFDAYFSNYIEGTEFEVDEARAIVFDHVIPRGRPDDARDIIGTYAVVGSEMLMSRSVRDDATPDPRACAVLACAHHGGAPGQTTGTVEGSREPCRGNAIRARYVAAIDWSSYQSAYDQLSATHAFEKPRLDIKLVMPGGEK